MTLPNGLFVLDLLVNGFLCGLIWFVQVVHYPLLADVDPAGFSRYHERHSALTTRVVALPMILDLGLSGLLIWQHPVGFDAPWTWLGFALALTTWACTFGLSVPLHRRLGAGHERATIARLVATNWPRTVAWTAHLALLGWRLTRLLSVNSPRPPR